MEREMSNFIKVWLIAIASACYCYTLSKITQRGILRLLFNLPIIYVFTNLPFFYLSSYHPGGITMFFLGWLGNFKLLLFSSDHGPLSEPLSLPQFVCILLLPIKIKPTNCQNVNDPNNQPTGKQDPKVDPSKKTGSGADPSLQVNGSSHKGAQVTRKSKVGRYMLFVAKCVAFACVIESYNYKESLPYFVLLVLYCCNLYLALEMVLAIAGVFARASLGRELAPQFNEPYLATSLQDFWGRRWNLMVSDILRQTVHNPIKITAAPLIRKKWATVLGVLASFLVSGLMHEFIFYYFTRVSPTWEVTWFFVLHGVCTAIEVIIKDKVSGKWRLTRAISGPLTVGFVAVTGVWLFFPQIFRNKIHEKAIDEYLIVANFIKRNVLYWFWH